MAQAVSNSQSSSPADRPERSRNAKAQARHRAKRKAYIEQLEQTVTKLQTALALSPEQVAALPPPTLRIRQLEQENSKLIREIDELRRQLHMQTRRPSLMTDPHFDIARRGSFQSSISSDYPDRELKRRRVSQNIDGVYLSPSQTPSPPTTEALARSGNFSPPPPPPPPLSHGYMTSSNHPSAYSSPGMNSSNSILSSGAQNGPLSYQLPAVHTPSSASTPTSYSSGNEHPSHLLVGGHGLPSSRPLPSTMHSAPGSHGLSGIPQYPSSQYDGVKVEEDYMSPTQESSHSLTYSPIHSFNHPHPAELSSWQQSYSADRTQIHP
ncbi:hypothetical protein F5148DRAFT_1208135 [Russula earlei]|uniref:Uncharacterized protein n=1 Tax=Russula earlei TaxID=71964 RepID=A0ACC0U634_9AGAM|nr:hypothetical protein F5148DRAFT_1208135 [Russula earlei]